MFCVFWEVNGQVFFAERHRFLGGKPLTNVKNLFCAVNGRFSLCMCFLLLIEMEAERWLNRHVKLINESRCLASLFKVMSELEKFPVTS